MKQHRGISLGAVADMGPNAYLLTSGLAALLHVGFAHVDAGRIMRLYPRWFVMELRTRPLDGSSVLYNGGARR